MYYDYKDSTGLLTYHIFRALSWLSVIGVTSLAFQNYEDWKALKWTTIAQNATSVIGCLAIVQQLRHRTDHGMASRRPLLPAPTPLMRIRWATCCSVSIKNKK
jgi:hypothetical protein